MGKCKDCKYWAKGPCEHPQITSFDDFDSEKSMVRYGADDCYGASIQTDKNFGCILFEAKE